MEAIVELLTSGNPWLVLLGIVLSLGAAAGTPLYYYIKDLKKRIKFWKERYQKKDEKLEEVKKSRLEEMRDYKQTLKESVAVNEKLQEEIQKQRKEEEFIEELRDQNS